MATSSRRLFLESLEGRTLLSTCFVTRLTDQGIGKGFRGDLRYCINKVNEVPGPDIIDFNVTGTIRLTGALPHLASDMYLNGPGVDLLAIDANLQDGVFVVETGANVRISGLTMTGGLADQYGGGIYNKGGLVLQDCAVKGNAGWRFGGGIYNEGALSIFNCEIADNIAKRISLNHTWGGGIYNAAQGTLFVTGSAILTNQIEPAYSYVSLGGGIANLGNAVVVDSTIWGNTANPAVAGPIGGVGGGIYNGGELVVDRSLIANNIAAGDFWGLGGGIGNGIGYTTVTNNQGGTVTIINSTITGNLAYSHGDVNYGDSRGGGISTEEGGSVTGRNSTIAGNRSWIGNGYVTSFGGGVSNVGLTEPSSVRMHNTIVAGNDAITGADDLHGGLTSSGYNLFQVSGGGTGYEPTDLLDVDPLLAPLANNGGLTLTIALLPGSPAIDAGDNTDAPPWDQRGPGFPRIVNGTIDIGAFEVQATAAQSICLTLDPLTALTLGDLRKFKRLTRR
jgi:hypothetical protein